MKNWSTDKIIGAGLITVLLILVFGSVIIFLCSGRFMNLDIVATIATGLIGYMKGSSEKKDGDKNDSGKNSGEKI